jgi:hypothetical protein
MPRVTTLNVAAGSANLIGKLLPALLTLSCVSDRYWMASSRLYESSEVATFLVAGVAISEVLTSSVNSPSDRLCRVTASVGSGSDEAAGRKGEFWGRRRYRRFRIGVLSDTSLDSRAVPTEVRRRVRLRRISHAGLLITWLDCRSATPGRQTINSPTDVDRHRVGTFVRPTQLLPPGTARRTVRWCSSSRCPR